MTDEKYRIIILGAGFSYAAGLPIASELWSEIRKRAASLSGRATKFHTDLADYINFKRICDGQANLNDETVDFEDFMRFLDIQHFLGLRGSDTWSVDGNESTVVVKTLIGQILAERMPETIPPLYIDFARKLRPHDYVLTFNYDVLLEQALEAAGTPFRLFPNRYSETPPGAFIDDSKPEVIVLKLHGSIDWFDRSGYADFQKERLKYGLTTPSEHPVFSSVDELGLIKVLNGPQQSNDPLDEMYRVRNIKGLYKKPLLFSATPWLLAPSALKIIYASKLRDFWYGLSKFGILNFGIAIVGYSLPEHDDYARQLIYDIIINYQQNYWGQEVFGQRKFPVVIVDNFRDDRHCAAFKNRYRFVNWDRTRLYGHGFDDQSLAYIFGEFDT